MKLILPALLVSTAWAQTQQPIFGNDDGDEESTGVPEEEAVDPLELLSGTVFREQEPVSFDAIEASDDIAYALSGTYGGYVTAGIDYVFIDMTVSGAELSDGNQVVMWAEIEEEVGQKKKIEAFYCMTTYSPENGYSEVNETTSFQGSNVDLSTVTGKPETWYTEEEDEEEDVDADEEVVEDGAKQQTINQWLLMFTDLDENYPSTWDEEAEESSQKCSVWRKRSSPDNYIEIMYGQEYNVRTGYFIYESAEAEVPLFSATGSYITMTFEAGTALVAASAAILATLLTF